MHDKMQRRKAALDDRATRAMSIDLRYSTSGRHNLSFSAPQENEAYEKMDKIVRKLKNKDKKAKEAGSLSPQRA